MREGEGVRVDGRRVDDQLVILCRWMIVYMFLYFVVSDWFIVNSLN